MMDRAVFDELRAEFNEALPGLIRGEPDRTDLMIPLCRATSDAEERVVGAAEVKAAIREVYGVTLAEIYAISRHDKVAVEARQMCAYVMVRHAFMSMAMTGRSLRRNHTTISYSVDKISEIVDRPEMARRLQRVLRLLGIIEG